MVRIGWLLVMVACSKAESPTTVPDDPRPHVTPRAPEVKVELAGVTLADDCADTVRTKPLAPPPARAAAPASARTAIIKAPSASMERGTVAGDCAEPNCGMPAPACEQTAMQLSVKVPDGAAVTKLRIKRVELLDAGGKPFGTLTARAASKWNGTDAYVPWDETIAAGKSDFAVSYKLTSPDWNKIAGGKWGAAGKKFTLRVTVMVSDKDSTVEKQATVEITPEPAVVT